jgi:hypothetical protein
VNKEKAEIILDFLYLIARTYKTKTNAVAAENQPKESNANNADGFKAKGGRIEAAARN